MVLLISAVSERDLQSILFPGPENFSLFVSDMRFVEAPQSCEAAKYPVNL